MLDPDQTHVGPAHPLPGHHVVEVCGDVAHQHTGWAPLAGKRMVRSDTCSQRDHTTSSLTTLNPSSAAVCKPTAVPKVTKWSTHPRVDPADWPCTCDLVHGEVGIEDVFSALLECRNVTDHTWQQRLIRLLQAAG